MKNNCIICAAELSKGHLCDECKSFAPALLEKLRNEVRELEIALSLKKRGRPPAKAPDEPATAQKSPEEVFREKQQCPVYINKQKLYEGLTGKILGQSEALKSLASATKIHLAKVRPLRPASIFMAGPTGCGKTESVNVLVEMLKKITDIKFELIRVDCNLYMESHRMASFMGAPQGYRDSGEPNLFSVLIDNPRQVILFDEIEKAHSNVLTAIMGILDYGKLKLSSPLKEKDKDGNIIKGNEGKDGISEIDFKYALIVFTSNLSLDPSAKKVGFTTDERRNLISVEDRCKEALVKAGVRPEIAGRITSFLQYKALSNSAIRDIIRLEIELCANSFGLIVYNVSDKIIGEIIEMTGAKFGMRAFKQLIESKMGESLADYAENTKNADDNFDNKIVVIEGTLKDDEALNCKNYNYGMKSDDIV